MSRASREGTDVLLTADLKLLLEALQDPLEVIELDVGEEHTVEENEKLSRASIRRMTSVLSDRRPKRQDSFPST